ncbi:DUF3558 domain-containing protein [Streptomyces sp. RB110-1]|uniref:DUF3558 domain-containing protein n=1 Tax=unclassified Streptomyces TaxID=2593676 RepID=UPI0019002B46|nr:MULTISPECIES: DUF3558 domain-containing protein [unclassified Streptomyces]MBK0376322.1 DUF3558 domain-containing protein [Streptomyces sp. RB110-1]MBK0387304.1 DUF3558 domain-containing protein [Streptomyces sp. RB110-2]
MHRSAPRLSRILACAAVPVMLVAVGCSSDSGSDGKKNAGSSSSGSASAKPSEPTVEPAKFSDLPDPCGAIGKKTVEDLVPDAKKKGGTAGQSSDLSARGSCSWNGLDDKGLKGSQYRWLDVGLTRFDSDQALGSGAERATADYTKQIAKAKAAEGATKVAAEATAGIGEEATVVTYGLSKTDEDFEYATVVARTGNVVVTLTYNGAGFAGGKKPSSADMVEGAQKAVKEAIGAVEKTAEATPPAKGEDKDADKGTEKAGDDGKKDSADSGDEDSPKEKAKATPKS